MKTRIVKNWRTTIAGIIAAALVILGILYPDKIDPDTREVLNAAVGQIIAGAGVIIAFITNLLAKD